MNDAMATALHGAAGQLVTREPAKVRDGWCRCGTCGKAWRASIDLRCKDFRLECPHCGQAAGLEINK